MSYENWKDKVQGFQTVDVRHIQGLKPLHLIVFVCMTENAAYPMR